MARAVQARILELATIENTALGHNFTEIGEPERAPDELPINEVLAAQIIPDKAHLDVAAFIHRRPLTGFHDCVRYSGANDHLNCVPGR